MIQPRILILGGTGSARRLADELLRSGYVTSENLTYSVAGRTQHPDMNCHMISGGFSSYADAGAPAGEGLKRYLESGEKEKRPHHLIIDATHPFAVNISHAAVHASSAVSVPVWQLRRKPWTVSDTERTEYAGYRCLIQALKERRKNSAEQPPVFLAIGHPDAELVSLLNDTGFSFVLRSVTRPDNMPQNCEWIQGRGPFTDENEQSLFRHYKIGALICKNSGGLDTDAKLQAARELNILVFMIQQPEIPAGDQIFYSTEDCLNAILKHELTTDT